MHSRNLFTAVPPIALPKIVTSGPISVIKLRIEIYLERLASSSRSSIPLIPRNFTSEINAIQDFFVLKLCRIGWK